MSVLSDRCDCLWLGVEVRFDGVRGRLKLVDVVKDDMVNGQEVEVGPKGGGGQGSCPVGWTGMNR